MKSTFNVCTMIDGKDLIYYCYNHEQITLEQFVSIENEAYARAMFMRHVIFKPLNISNTPIFRMCLN